MSSLSDFLGEIGRHKLLTPEKELTMGRKVQEMVVLINRCQIAGGKGHACEYTEAEKKKIKIGEKAKNEIANEASDIIYHLQVALLHKGVEWRDVLTILESRRKKNN